MKLRNEVFSYKLFPFAPSTTANGLVCFFWNSKSHVTDYCKMCSTSGRDYIELLLTISKQHPAKK